MELTSGLGSAQGGGFVVAFISHTEKIIRGHSEGSVIYNIRHSKAFFFPCKIHIHFLTSLQTNRSITGMCKQPPVSLFHEDSSRSVRANCSVASANICMLLSSLLYPCHGKCFSFSSVYRNGQATPPLSIHHNQIYSGLSTRLVGTICLRQTLRALVCH